MARGRKSNASSNNTDYSDLIKKITDVQDLDNFVSMITYGRSGTGKTTFAGTWPKPALVLDIKDDGTDSIKEVEGIKVLTIDNWDDFEKIYWYLKSGDHPYKSVHVDTISNLQDKAKEKVVGNSKMVSQNNWGEIAGIMGTWLINYRDLVDDGLHVHFIAQDRLTESDADEEDDNQIDPSVGPRLMPSLASKINAAVKVIGNTYIAEEVERTEGKIKKVESYRMRLGPHAYYITKIRKPKRAKSPKNISDPNFNTIIDIMNGNYGKSAKATTDKPKKPRNRKPKA